MLRSGEWDCEIQHGLQQFHETKQIRGKRELLNQNVKFPTQETVGRGSK